MKIGGFGAGRDEGKGIPHIRNKQKQGAQTVLDVFGEQYLGWLSTGSESGSNAPLISVEHAFYLGGSKELFF